MPDLETNMSEPTPELWAFAQGQSLFALKEDQRHLIEGGLFLGKGPKSSTGFLLIHGFNSTPYSMHRIQEKLQQQGYSVACPRLPGHGQNVKAMCDVSYPQWLSACDNAYGQLAQTCDKICLIGQSFGATLALLLAAKPREVEHLFLLSPALYPTKKLAYAQGPLKLMNMLGIKYLNNTAGDIKNPNGYDFSYNKLSIHSLIELYQCMRKAQQTLKHIHCPTTVFFAKEDHVVPRKNAEHLLGQLASHEKTLHIIENAYHILSVEEGIDEVIEQVLAVVG